MISVMTMLQSTVSFRIVEKESQQIRCLVLCTDAMPYSVLYCQATINSISGVFKINSLLDYITDRSGNE